MTRLLTLLPLIAGCQILDNSEASTWAENLPDDRVQIDFPDASTAKSADREWSEYYLLTHALTDNVNGMAGFVLHLVGTLSQYRPTTVDSDAHMAEWGPWSDALDPVETVMWMQRDPATGEFDWGFDQWPKDDDSARVTVIEGHIDAGATRQASSGNFSVDFGTIYELDPTTDVVSGTFDVVYDISPERVTGTADFAGWDTDELDAAYAYDQIQDGEGTMDLVVLNDINPPSGTDELYLIRSRWTAEGEGRADVVLTDGDLGDESGTLNECWNTSFEVAYHADDFGGETVGDESDCAYEDAEYCEISL